MNLENPPVQQLEPPKLEDLSDEELDKLVVEKMNNENLSDEELDRRVIEKMAKEVPVPVGPAETVLRSSEQGLMQQTFGVPQYIRRKTAELAGEYVGPEAKNLIEKTPVTPSEKYAELAGVLEAMYNPPINPATGKPIERWQAVQNVMKPMDVRQKQYTEEHPIASTLSEVGAILTPAGAGGVMAMPRKLASGSQLISKAAKALEGPGLSKLAGRITAGAAGGGAEAYGLQKAREATGLAEGEISPEEAGKFGAVVGGAIPLVGAAATGARKLTGWAGRKAIETFLGPSEKVQLNYLDEIGKNPKLLNNVPNEKELVSRLEENINKVKGEGGSLETKNKDFRDNIITGIRTNRDKLAQYSKESYDILDKTNKFFPKEDLLNKIRKQQEALKVEGAFTDKQSEELYNILQDYINMYENFPDKIKMTSIKSILQGLDNETKRAYDSKLYTKREDIPFVKLRHDIDQQLKSYSNEYSEKMKVVSRLTGINDVAIKAFGEEAEDAAGEFTKLMSPSKITGRRERLIPFFKESGIDYKEMENFQKDYTQLKGLTTKNASSFINSFAKKRTADSYKTIQKLADMADDKELMEMADAYRAAYPFERGFTNGSKNVLFHTLLGMTGYSAYEGDVSPTGVFAGGAAGMLAGGAMGMLVDKFGPRMARIILDTYSRSKGLPTLAKIDKLDLAPHVKSFLKDDLMRSQIVRKGETKPIKIEDTGSVKQDIMNSKDLNNIEKSSLYNQVSRTGEADPKLMHKLIYGNEKEHTASSMAQDKLREKNGRR